MVQAKLKNPAHGLELRAPLPAADSIEKADMETHELEFLYQGGDTYHFMNTRTTTSSRWTWRCWAKRAVDAAGDEDPGRVLRRRPIGIQLPNSLVLEIVETVARP
jgi:elongation factor P